MMFLREKFRSEQFRVFAHVLFLSISTLEITSGQSSCPPISATQSKTWGIAYASRAIDNDTSTCSVSAGPSYTSFGWWQMDLGSNFTVYSVTVTSGYDSNYTGSWPFYVQNFSISVGMTNSTEIVDSDLCYYYNEECYLKAGIASTFVCPPKPLRGRYVTLKRRGGDRQDAISLCEVSVQCEQPPSSSSTSASRISSVCSSQLTATNGCSTAGTTHDASSTSLEASAIAAIVLGSILLLCLVIIVVLIFRLTRLKYMLGKLQAPYTVPNRETDNEQPHQYETLRNSQRDSIFPTTGVENIHRNAYILDDK